MTVAVDGVERYHWPVSTGLPSYETPNGSFRTFRMEEDHYSKEFDDAPMPHSIFFTKIGHAIHGTDSVNRLGSPASHGCVRLSRANAATLYALVQAGRRAQHHGDADRLVAGRAGAQSAGRAQHRRGAPRPGAAIQRRQRYDRAGDPVVLTPQRAAASRRRPRPMTAISIRPTALRTRRAIRRRAAAASTARRSIRSAAILRQSRLCAAIAPQGYYTSRGQYYQPRGLFTYQD